MCNCAIKYCNFKPRSKRDFKNNKKILMFAWYKNGIVIGQYYTTSVSDIV